MEIYQKLARNDPVIIFHCAARCRFMVVPGSYRGTYYKGKMCRTLKTFYISGNFRYSQIKDKIYVRNMGFDVFTAVRLKKVFWALEPR
jgi:hypothetical protein